jgi:hypothetical protein
MNLTLEIIQCILSVYYPRGFTVAYIILARYEVIGLC